MLGYLFERFPCYTQTFCAREVRAMRERGFSGPVFSVRTRCEQPSVPDPGHLGEVLYLPAQFDDILASDAAFRRDARRAQEDMRRLWGGEGEKYRIYESLWLERACAAHGVTHLHTHFAGIAARTAFWLRRRGGPTYSITAHANDIFRDEPTERLAQLLDSASFVATVSDFSVAHLVARFPHAADKIHRVYNGIRIEAFPRAEFPDGTPLILSVGRAIEKKGFGDLIAACALLGDRDYSCRIIGGGPLEESLRAQVSEAGLAGKVSVEGPMPESEVLALLAKASIFALPCVVGVDGSMDNLPTVIMEAMAAGLPVVSTPVAGVPEMVKDGASGFLVPEHDPALLATRLAMLLDDGGMVRRMGEEGRRRCGELFDIRNTSARLCELFEGSGVRL